MVAGLLSFGRVFLAGSAVVDALTIVGEESLVAHVAVDIIGDVSCNLQLLGRREPDAAQGATSRDLFAILDKSQRVPSSFAADASSLDPQDRSQLEAAQAATEEAARAVNRFKLALGVGDQRPRQDLFRAPTDNSRREEWRALHSDALKLRNIPILVENDKLRARETDLLHKVILNRDRLSAQEHAPMSLTQYTVNTRRNFASSSDPMSTIKLVVIVAAVCVLSGSVFWWITSGVDADHNSLTDRIGKCKQVVQGNGPLCVEFCSAMFPVLVVCIFGLLWLASTGALDQLLGEMQLMVFVVGTAVFALGVFINRCMSAVRDRLMDIGNKFHEFDQRSKILQKQVQDIMKLRDPLRSLKTEKEDAQHHDVRNDPLLLANVWDVATDPFGIAAHPPSSISTANVLLRKFAATLYIAFQNLDHAFTTLSGNTGVLTHNEFVSRTETYFDKVEGMAGSAELVWNALDYDGIGYLDLASFSKPVHKYFDACVDAGKKVQSALELGQDSALDDAIKRAKQLYLNRCAIVLDATKGLLDSRIGSVSSARNKQRGQVKLRSDPFLTKS